MVRRLRDREVGSASGSAPDYRPPDTLHSRSHFGYCTEWYRDTTIDHRPSGSLSDRRGTSAAAVERGVVTRKRGGGPRHSSFTRNLSVAFSAPSANAMPRSKMFHRVPEVLYIIGSLGEIRSLLDHRATGSKFQIQWFCDLVTLRLPDFFKNVPPVWICESFRIFCGRFLIL